MTESSSPGRLHDLRATSGERRAAGRAARTGVRRGTLGYWKEKDRGHDALETILAQNQIRVPELVPIRHHRMAASPWNYYPGRPGRTGRPPSLGPPPPSSTSVQSSVTRGDRRAEAAGRDM